VSPAAIFGFAALGSVVLGRLLSRRTADAAPSQAVPTGGAMVLETLFGPPPDPCLGDAYSRTAQPLLAEAYENVKPQARALYGDRPVYFITPQVQGQAFVRIAQIRVNAPNVEPVIKVAQELAPDCDWLAPIDRWSKAMIAFRDSLERLVQIVDTDIGEAPELQRPHAWEKQYTVLRDKREIQVDAGDVFAFELPLDAQEGKTAVKATGISSPDQLETVGIIEYKLKEGPNYVLRPVLAIAAKSAGDVFLTATSQSGAKTTGSVTIT